MREAKCLQSGWRLCSDLLCGRYSRRRNDQVVVHHDVSGWEQLCTILQDVFPEADRDWRSKAAHDHTNMDQYLPVASVVPIFTVNPTTVWSQ